MPPSSSAPRGVDAERRRLRRVPGGWGRRLHSRPVLLVAFAFAVMADPVSSVAYSIEAALRALHGDLGLLLLTMSLVVVRRRAGHHQLSPAGRPLSRMEAVRPPRPVRRSARPGRSSRSAR